MAKIRRKPGKTVGQSIKRSVGADLGAFWSERALGKPPPIPTKFTLSLDIGKKDVKGKE